MNITLRIEQPSDYRETENVTRDAFWNCHTPGCDEHYLLHIMRQTPAFVPELDFVAVYNGVIVGNVVCARSIIKTDGDSEREVLGLGPISVRPEFQNKSIGSRLIGQVKIAAREYGFRAIFLYGDPEYYSRNGFVSAESYDIRTHDDMYADALQVFELYDRALSGTTGRYFEDKIYNVDSSAAAEFDKTFRPKKRMEGTASQARYLELVSLKRKRAVS